MDNFNDQLNEKRLQLDKNPDDFDANFGVGDVYYQEGEKFYNQAGSFSDQNSEQKSLVSNGEKMMQDSMPYFEKAFDLKPTKNEAYSRLESVYTKLNLSEKIKGINERIRE